MKRLPTALAALVAIVVLVLGVGAVGWWPARRAAPPRLETEARGAGPLLAGAATVTLEPAPPVPVAGFPKLHWEEEGRRDPVAVRALALREPGCTVVLVSAEILLVPASLQHAVERRVRDLHVDQVLVAATHTHSGPGGYWHDALGERVATGPYRADIREHVVDRIAQAVRAAVASLEPAYLSVARGAVTDLAKSRSGGTVDGRLLAMRLVARGGATVAMLVDYPSHPTLLGDGRRLSGDWAGALMRRHTDPLLFFQGALGDQAPRMPPGLAADPELYARALDDRLARLEWSPPDPWPELAVASATAVLPSPDPGAAPRGLRTLARNVLHGLVPARARVVALRLGPVLLAAVPAEPVTEVGRRWRAAVGPALEVVSLAGEYLGYVETRERMADRAGETVRTYYGPELAERLGAAVGLAARTAGVPRPGIETAQNRTAGVASGAAGAPPESIER